MKKQLLLLLVALAGAGVAMEPAGATSEPEPVFRTFSETIAGPPQRTLWTFMHSFPRTYGGTGIFSGHVDIVISCEEGEITEYLLTIPSTSDARFYRGQTSLDWRLYNGGQIVERGQWASPQFSDNTYDSVTLAASDGPTGARLRANPDHLVVDMVMYPFTSKAQELYFSLLGLSDAIKHCAGETP